MKPRVHSKVSSRHQAPRVATQPKRVRDDYDAVLKNFETALGQFRKHRYEKAAELFEKVAASSVQEMAERARMHLRLCAQKSGQQASPKTAEDFYVRGVAALNNGQFELAIQHLSKSDKMKPRQGHVQYALAAAHGLQGDSDSALTHLQAAIDLQPSNRVQARHDDDFQLLAADPRFGRLVGLRT